MFTTPMFKCKWVHNKSGVKMDESGTYIWKIHCVWISYSCINLCVLLKNMLHIILYVCF